MKTDSHREREKNTVEEAEGKHCLSFIDRAVETTLKSSSFITPSSQLRKEEEGGEEKEGFV